MPAAAKTVSSRDCARSGRCSSRQGVFAMFHIRASSHCARPMDAARKSTLFKKYVFGPARLASQPELISLKIEPTEFGDL